MTDFVGIRCTLLKLKKTHLTSGHFTADVFSEMVSLFAFGVHMYLFSSESVKCYFFEVSK